MFGIKTFLRNLMSVSYSVSLRMRNRNLTIGKHVQFVGLPLFRISRDATVKLGAHVKFVSDRRENMVGLFKKCSVAVVGRGSLEIGDHSGFSGVSIYCTNEITIGRYVNCGGNVSIWDTDFHPLDPLERRKNNVSGIRTSPIRIGNDVFIGANSIILKGTEIGDNTVIGAGSVVKGRIPPNEIWAGNPARLIRKLEPATIFNP